MARRAVTVKLILVGASAVGKTSLVGAFFRQRLEGDAVPTVSPAFSNATIDVDADTTVNLQIWDTAGQEQYQSISQMFYREAHIAFICYDGDAAASVARWVARVREHAPDARLYLVTTKADLLADDAPAMREGADRAALLGARHFVTSARTGRNVMELFETAARDAVCGSMVVQPGGKARLDVRERRRAPCC
jgi:small GTP-binding protein